MKISITDAKEHLPELLRSAGEGEAVVITRCGAPVAQLVPSAPGKRVVRFGTMRARIHLKPGWDDPVDVDQFLAGEFR
jgi:prevent-host-death family protein